MTYLRTVFFFVALNHSLLIYYGDFLFYILWSEKVLALGPISRYGYQLLNRITASVDYFLYRSNYCIVFKMTKRFFLFQDFVPTQ